MTNKNHKEGGYVIIILSLIFSAIALALVLGGAVPVMSHLSATNGYNYSKQAFLASNSAIDEAVYRLKAGMNLPSSVAVLLGTTSAYIVTTATPSGKEVTVTSTNNTYQRNLVADLAYSGGVAFNYGLQAGNGGMDVGGGSTINGNVYSNGEVDAISATITGTAVSADGGAMTADQINNQPNIPGSSINFRDSSGTQDFAQSFQLSASAILNKISLYIKKVGSPANGTVYLVADNAGSPSTTQLPIGSLSLNAASVTTSYSWTDLVFPTPPALIGGTTYWLVLDNGSQSSSNYYVIGANSAYSSGTGKTGSYGGSWTDTGLDGYFIAYTGGTTGLVGGATYTGGVTIGSGTVGDAWATNVKGASVAGHNYCTTGTNNNKSCDTSKGAAPSVSMPYTDQNITDWKADAASGGTISGDYTVDWRNGTLGPKEITGNMLVSGGGTLTMTGTLYIHGTVTVTGGGKIVLPSSFAKNSATIISDSRMSIAGGGSAGSGDSASYLFLVSTSKCPYDSTCGGNDAITVTGGAGAIAVNAQNGTVNLSGGANIKAAVGNYVVIGGGSTVTYDSGLASPSFNSGPSGGFTLTSWKEN